METFSYYYVFFMLIALFGWCMEVGCKLVDDHKFINRGFLIGPYCPIYGWGCIGLVVLLSPFRNAILNEGFTIGRLIVLFSMSIVICCFLEYFTSYFMEKIFHARWWDYSQKKYNLNGRICAETMIPFGILGTVVNLIVYPFYDSMVNSTNPNVLNILAIVLLVIFLTDNIISFVIMAGFKDTMKTVEKDATEEITKRVKEVLMNRGYLYKRLALAFPSMITNIERLQMMQDRINMELKKAQMKATEKMNRAKEIASKKINESIDSANKNYQALKDAYKAGSDAYKKSKEEK